MGGMSSRLTRLLPLVALALLPVLTGCDSPSAPIPPDDTVDPIDTEAAWSPDGNSILYTHAVDHIWRLNLTSGARESLTTGRSPAWSPDGRSIALIDGYRLYVMDLATGTKQVIGPNAPSFQPAWSPDGRRIAYGTNYGDLDGSNAIALIHPDGSEFDDITQHGTGEWNQPRWSPDGAWLVHRRYVNGFAELFVMDTTGAQPRRLTNDEANDEDPAWSPDGQWIAWSWYAPDQTQSGLWLMRSDGANRRLVIAGGFDPSWAPDGNRIVFSYWASRDTGATIWTIHPDGSNLTRLIPSY